MPTLIKNEQTYYNHVFKQDDIKQFILKNSDKIFSKEIIIFNGEQVSQKTGLSCTPDIFIVDPHLEYWAVVFTDYTNNILDDFDMYGNIFFNKITKLKNDLEVVSIKSRLIEYIEREILIRSKNLEKWTNCQRQEDLFEKLVSIIDNEPRLQIFTEEKSERLIDVSRLYPYLIIFLHTIKAFYPIGIVNDETNAIIYYE